MERILSIIAKVCLILLAITACEKQQEIASLGSRSVNITIEDIAVTKAAQHKPKTETIKQFDLSDSLVLTVKVSDIPAAAKPETKGTNITTSTFFEQYGTSGFSVYAEKHGDPSTVLFGNDLFKYDGIVWSPETDIPWPEYATDYYAWAPSDIASLTASSKSFSYTVPQNNEDQTDLLVAKAQTEEGFEGSLHMTFNHALSEIKFTVNENIPAGTFYSLSLYQLKMNGSYDFTTGEWTIPGDAQKGSVTLDLSSSPVSIFENASEGDAITSDSQTFFVLPQTLSAYSSGIELQFKGPDDLEPKTYYLDFEDGFEFESNKCYTFAIGQTPREFYFGLDLKSSSSISISNDVANSGEYIITPDSFRYNPDYFLSPDYPDYTFENCLQDEYPFYQWDDYDEMDRIPWHIKSYIIKGVVKDYSEEALIADGGLDVKVIDKPDCDGKTQSISITGLARTGVENHLAENSTWTGSFGKWSPDDWTDKGVIDLSRMDVKKDTYAESVNAFEMTTANCYVIRHAGHYKFPLVYGNAMNKGAVDEVSYDMSDNIRSSYHYRSLLPLTNHLGNSVTSPFIEQNEGVTLASGTSAYDILWQDQAQIITIDKIEQEEVEVTDTDGSKKTVSVSYLYFTIPQNLICQNNALLCVKDTEGRIVWSWHIWTTNNPSMLDEEKIVTSSFQFTNTYYFHPMNYIGWIDPSLNFAARDDVELVIEQEGTGKELRILVMQPETTFVPEGMYYQWGRKDPFPAKGCVSLDEAPLSQGSIESIADGNEVAVSETIKNPTSFFCSSNDRGEGYWEQDHHINLWGAIGSTYVSSEGDQYNYDSDLYVKTIYDPSPIGYKVPTVAAFSAFAEKLTNQYQKPYQYNKGCDFWTYPYNRANEAPDNYSTIFFSTTGFRSYYDKGIVKESKGILGYWSCSLFTEMRISGWGYLYNPFTYFDEENLDYFHEEIWHMSRFYYRYSAYNELFFRNEGFSNGCAVRPVLYERFENEPHIEDDGISVTPYENENVTKEW